MDASLWGSWSGMYINAFVSSGVSCHAACKRGRGRPKTNRKHTIPPLCSKKKPFLAHSGYTHALLLTPTLSSHCHNSILKF